MKDYIFNNDEHTIPPIKEECPLCSFSMKLEAKEDTKGEVTYFYECSYVKCGKIEEVK